MSISRYRMWRSLCPSTIKWRLPADWTIVQSNGWHVGTELSQDGNSLIGQAHGGRDKEPDMTGIANGSIDGDHFHMTIYWPDNMTCNYLGTVDAHGKAEGTIVDASTGATIANWYGEPALSEWR